MKLVTFESDGVTKPGLVTDGKVVDLSSLYQSMNELIADGDTALERIGEVPAGDGPNLGDVTLRAPLAPNNIFCVGWNYLAHFEEGAGKRDEELPEHPAFFSKSSGTAIGPDAEVPSHQNVTSKLDYEVELTVVFGAPGADIPEAEALRHVFGYTIGNDVSAREVQRRHGGQWVKGKSLDGTCPLGPWIVTPDEIPDPQKLDIGCRVNGEQRQKSSTERMIFPVADLIHRLSEGLTLQPCDIMLTGTPEGVAMGMEDPQWLQPGDVIECEVASIGVLRSTVASS
jgi:2,4-didehydro-3-deoxy-L-rhamnonate hydrolase